MCLYFFHEDGAKHGTVLYLAIFFLFFFLGFLLYLGFCAILRLRPMVVELLMFWVFTAHIILFLGFQVELDLHT